MINPSSRHYIFNTFIFVHVSPVPSAHKFPRIFVIFLTNLVDICEFKIV